MNLPPSLGVVFCICVSFLTACIDRNETAPATEADDAGAQWTTESIHRSPANASTSLLVDVELVGQSGTESITFTFDSTLPGIDAGYAEDTVYRCGSGKPVSITGPHVFTIRFEPAAAHQDGSSTLDQRRYMPELPLIQEMDIICDFEAHLNWAIGVNARSAYRIITDTSQAQVLLEFRN